jgi:hypothetical protein
VLTASLVAGGGLTLPAGAADSGSACAEPQITRTYDGTALTHRIRIDLQGCPWWKGAPFEIASFLSRYDGVNQDVDFAISDDCTDMWTDSGYHPERTVCDVTVRIEHPGIETARYIGDIVHHWAGGVRITSFRAVCVTAVVSFCRDLPVAPLSVG